MARWINADALKEALKQNMPQYMWGEMFVTVNIQPFIDIVRCGECRNYYNQYGVSACMLHIDWSVDADDFCSFGERKESE